MSCCSETKTKDAAGGCGCATPTALPWFSALCDPALRRQVLRRFRRELLLGLASGALVSLAALFLGDGLGPLGPALRGPWLHFHAAAVLPAALLGGIGLTLGLARKAGPAWLPALAWATLWTVLGGAGNGLLEVGDGFLQNGGAASVLAFALLGVPALTLAAWSLGRIWPRRAC